MINTKTAILSLLAASTMMLSPVAHAQDYDAALKALDDALPGQLLHNPFDLEWGAEGNDMRTKVVTAEALTSGQAISAKLKKKQTKPWDSSVNVQIPDAVNKGDEVQIYFYARTAKPAAGKDTASIALFLGRNKEPYDYIVLEDIYPSSEWELQNLTGVANADYPAGTIKVQFQLGKAAQTVEFGSVYVSTLGPKATG